MSFLALALLLSCPAPQAATAPAAHDAFLARLDQAIAEHPYFSRVDYQRALEWEPFVFYLQDPPKQDPDYLRRVTSEFGPWCRKLREIFVRDYVVPLGLQDDGTTPLHALAVMSSEGAYSDFAKALDQQDLNATRAHYNPESRIAFTYWDSFSSKGFLHERRPALHEMVHALQHRYGTKVQRPERNLWLEEGLAEYLSYHLLQEVEDLERHRLDFQAVKEVGGLLIVPQLRDVFLHPAQQLTAFTSYYDVARTVALRGAKAGLAIDPQIAISAFYREAYLFVHFLHQGEQGKYRERFGQCLASAQAGKVGAAAFETAFQGVSWRTLDEEFLRYVEGFAREEYPELKAGRLTHKIRAEPMPASTAVPASLPEVALLKPALALGEGEVDARVAAALATAFQGDFEAGITALEALAAASLSEAEGERVQVELGRMREWVGVRDRYLEELARQQQTLKLEGSGVSVQGKVLARREGLLVLEGKGGTQTEVPVSALPPVELRKQISNSWFTAETECMKLYPYCVAGDTRWKKYSDSTKSAARKALVADADDYYPRILALGEVTTAFGRLREIDPAQDAESAELWLETLRSLQASSGEQALFQSRREALRGLAEVAFATQAGTLGLEDLLAAKVETLDSGRTRLSYVFDEPGELGDFLAADDYLSGLHDILEDVSSSASTCSLSDGKLMLSGRGCRRLAVDFEAPIEIRFRMTYLFQEAGGSQSPGFFSFGVCGDDLENAITCEFGLLLSRLQLGRHVEQAAKETKTNLMIGMSTRYEILHDGKSVELRINGANGGEIDADGQSSGSVFFWLHTPHQLVLPELTIEGKISEASLARLRRRWASAEVDRLGLR